MASAELKLKLLIDSKGGRILFGEADKNVIDFLFNLLSLPLSTVIRLLKTQGMVGCLPNLYESVESLNDTYLQPNHSKDSLLKPKVSNYSLLLKPKTKNQSKEKVSKYSIFKPKISKYNLLKPKAKNQSKDSLLKPKVSFCSSTLHLPNVGSSSSATKFYMCSYRCDYYVANDPTAVCPSCSRCMNREATIMSAPNAANIQKPRNDEEGGFVKGVVTYMVMDDLTVKPMSTISSITLLNKFNIKDVGALEEKIITLDINQGVKLLQFSLHSSTVLNDVFLERILTTPETGSKVEKKKKATLEVSSRGMKRKWGK